MAVDFTPLNANSINNINTNFQRVDTALQDAVSRSGNTPNQMNSDFDMNSNDILNVGLIDAQDFTIGGVPINGALEVAVEAALAAEASAQNAAQSEADALAAAAEAEAALAEIEGIVAGLQMTNYATKALAQASSLVEAPLYIRIESFAAVGDNGGGLYRKVVSQPTHSGKLSITLQDTTVVWYELIDNVLRPEQFGSIGVNTAGDTAAWVALATVANFRVNKVRIEANGEYLISGSTIIFSNLSSIEVRLNRAVLRQQVNFSKTLQFQTCAIAKVYDGTLYGRGGAAGEYNGASSSPNGVAGLYFLNCDYVEVDGLRGIDHANPDIRIDGGRVRRVHNCDLKGIGFPFIDPIGQGNQGNNSDFGIMAVPTNNALGWIYEDEFTNNRVYDHAFGIQTVQTKSSIITGNAIGPCPGQHGIYGIENLGMVWTDNIFRNCRQHAAKMQLENYAGLYIGTLWATATSYSVGNEVRNGGNLYICLIAHTSGTFATDLAANRWLLSPKNFIEGGIFSSNIIEDCGNGFAVLESSEVTAYFKFCKGMYVSDNTFRRTGDKSIALERCLNSSVESNKFYNDAGIPIWLKNYTGYCSNNHFYRGGWSSIYLAPAGSINDTLHGTAGITWIEGNHFVDCGLLGTSDDRRCPMGITFVTDTAIPGLSTAKQVKVNRNEVRYTTGDASGPWYYYNSETNTTLDISETRCNPGTTKLVRNDGTAGIRYRNDFPGFVNTAQNSPTWTISNGSQARTYDASAADLSATKNAVYTILLDLKGTQIIK